MRTERRSPKEFRKFTRCRVLVNSIDYHYRLFSAGGKIRKRESLRNTIRIMYGPLAALDLSKFCQRDWYYDWRIVLSTSDLFFFVLYLVPINVIFRNIIILSFIAKENTFIRRNMSICLDSNMIVSILLLILSTPNISIDVYRY